MPMMTIRYEASADKDVEIIEYEDFDQACEALISRYNDGNPIVYAETGKFLLWVCDPTCQIHVSYRVLHGDDSC